jgi:hypothetical protein
MRRLATTLVVAGALAGATGIAAASPPPKNGGTTTGGSAGSCSESPNPVAVGGTYTITGTRLPANQLVSVAVRDAAGSQWGSVQTSATGALTFTGPATVRGSYSVTISGSGKHAGTLGSCSFSAT